MSTDPKAERGAVYSINGHEYRVDRVEGNEAWLSGITTPGEVYMTLDEDGRPWDSKSWAFVRSAER